MGQLTKRTGRWIIPLALLAALTLAVGCTKTATAVSSTTIEYSGALSTSYDGALDVTTQFALGTLKLEGTPNAVTEEQAAKLLPLWQALQGSVAQTGAEKSAVIRQIEAAMTQPQVAAIAEMQLTQDAIQTWGRDRGMPAPGGAGSGTPQPGGQGQQPSGDMATRRAQFNQMSDSERATAMAQFGGQRGQQGSGTPRARPGGAMPGGTGSSAAGTGGPSFLITALVTLLQQRSGALTAQATASAEPRATIVFMSQTPTATVATALATTSAPTQTPTPASTATPAPAATTNPSPTVETTSAPGNTPAPTKPASATTARATAAARATATPQPSAAPALTQLEDKDPGPPFSIEISANQATVDPLDAQNVTYKVTGLVRNNGSDTYTVSAINVTFFDAGGFRGSFYRFPQPWETGGEWVWHGKTEAAFGCLLLAPGETCPFGVEITARNMASFLVHADATVTGRQSVPVTLSNLRVTRDGSSYVRITGTATNSNSFTVKNVNVAGTLLDANGQIVSVGSTYIVQTGIVPGGSVSVDLRLPAASYANYRLYGRAEQE